MDNDVWNVGPDPINLSLAYVIGLFVTSDVPLASLHAEKHY